MRSRRRRAGDLVSTCLGRLAFYLVTVLHRTRYLTSRVIIMTTAAAPLLEVYALSILVAYAGGGGGGLRGRMCWRKNRVFSNNTLSSGVASRVDGCHYRSFFSTCRRLPLPRLLPRAYTATAPGATCYTAFADKGSVTLLVLRYFPLLCSMVMMDGPPSVSGYNTFPFHHTSFLRAAYRCVPPTYAAAIVPAATPPPPSRATYPWRGILPLLYHLSYLTTSFLRAYTASTRC